MSEEFFFFFNSRWLVIYVSPRDNLDILHYIGWVVFCLRFFYLYLSNGSSFFFWFSGCLVQRVTQFPAPYFILALCNIINLGGVFFLVEVLVNFFGHLYISGAKRSHRDTELCKRLVFVNIYCTITLEVIVLLGAERQDICSGPLSIVATKLLSARCNLMLNWVGMNPNLMSKLCLQRVQRKIALSDLQAYRCRRSAD